MASLEFDPASGRYRIRFRYRGKPYKRSLKTVDKREAESLVGRVEDTLRLLERGRIELPSDCEPGLFILSDGKLHGKATHAAVVTLQDLFGLYREKLPEGAKEATTLEGENIHIKHLLRHLKSTAVVQTIAVGDLQAYVEKRLHDQWRGKADSTGHHREGS